MSRIVALTRKTRPWFASKVARAWTTAADMPAPSMTRSLLITRLGSVNVSADSVSVSPAAEASMAAWMLA